MSFIGESTKTALPLETTIKSSDGIQLARLFWLGKLDSSSSSTAQTLSPTQVVDRILRHVSSNASLASFKEECESLWKQALGAIRSREILSAAYADDEKLIVPDVPPNGRVSFIDDPKKLGELNDQVVQLTKQLASLLDQLLGAK